MCTVPYPQVNYGQGSGAWNPSDRSEMYRAVERARTDDSFARKFAADIMFARSDDLYGADGVITRSQQSRSTSKKSAAVKQKEYRPNTLNPTKSWVSQAFGNPVMRSGDSWHTAIPGLSGALDKKGNTKSFSYDGTLSMPGNKITDAQTIRMLNEGHFAFKTANGNGEDLYVPWARGYAPAKGGQGKPERGRNKGAVATGGAGREMVTADTARPGNMLAGAGMLLGADTLDNRKKMLLG